MKRRKGFVSNSSSTSFTFCFKGKKLKALTDLILTKYRDQFSRSFEEWHCNALDVVHAMERCAERKGLYFYEKIEVVSVNKMIAAGKEAIKQGKAEIKEANKKSDPWLGELYYRSLHRSEYKLQKYQDAKSRGLTKVLTMGFGDNHGHVSGGDLGYAMDYDGREIDIDAKDFIVFTEQNR